MLAGGLVFHVERVQVYLALTISSILAAATITAQQLGFPEFVLHQASLTPTAVFMTVAILSSSSAIPSSYIDLRRTRSKSSPLRTLSSTIQSAMLVTGSTTLLWFIHVVTTSQEAALACNGSLLYAATLAAISEPSRQRGASSFTRLSILLTYILLGIAFAGMPPLNHALQGYLWQEATQTSPPLASHFTPAVAFLLCLGGGERPACPPQHL